MDQRDSLLTVAPVVSLKAHSPMEEWDLQDAMALVRRRRQAQDPAVVQALLLVQAQLRVATMLQDRPVVASRLLPFLNRTLEAMLEQVPVYILPLHPVGQSNTITTIDPATQVLREAGELLRPLEHLPLYVVVQVVCRTLPLLLLGLHKFVQKSIRHCNPFKHRWPPYMNASIESSLPVMPTMPILSMALPCVVFDRHSIMLSRI